MLLAFDTSSAAVTVALHDGEQIRAESTVVDALRHGELLAPGIAAVLEAAGVRATDLTRIAVGIGPGPYTGLRVGVMTGRAMSAALTVPLVGVCTLDVLAVEASESGVVGPDGIVVATDARRREVFWARYVGDASRVDGPHVSKPDDIGKGLPVVGRGAALYPESLGQPLPPEYPSASVLARMVGAGDLWLMDPEPIYLRRPDVAVPGRRKSVL